MPSLFTRFLGSTASVFVLFSPMILPATENMDYAVKVILFPVREAVLSSEVDSSVLSFEKQEGETFQKDDVLVKLNPSLYDNQLIRAKASLEEAEASHHFEKQNYDIVKKMLDGALASDLEVAQADLNIKVAESKLNFQQAMYDLAVKQRALCDIRAPFPGRMVQKKIQPFEFVRTSQNLVTIIDDSALLGVMPLPSATKKDIKLGDNVDILVEETGSVVTGQVYEIAGQIDFVSRTFEIKVIIDNTARTLSAGMSGTLQAIRPVAPAAKQEVAQ